MAQSPSPGSNPGRGDDTKLSDAGATYYLTDAGALYTFAAQVSRRRRPRCLL